MASSRVCRNSSLTGKDELTGKDLTDGSGTPVVSHALTPTLPQVLAPALASALGPPYRFMDEDLQKATKLVLELFV